MNDTESTGSSGGGGGGSSLPNEIVQAIAISNAKSIGEQPAILANMALANQILNNNLQQQMQLSYQQAVNQINMATISKCVAIITGGESVPDPGNMLTELKSLLGALQPSGNDDSTKAQKSPPAPEEQEKD